ncbi:MAG: bifunctional glycosyltransferase family 2/GtrA family protein [Ruminococcus sp.]|jgi:putative flippase GtrA|nr:bifunctional glycosyltransferase family 2/GtrA family protein [Ruminococcus sp.]
MNFIVIPSCNPSTNLIDLVNAIDEAAAKLTEFGEKPQFVIVNDGSDSDEIFVRLIDFENVTVITHPQNRGKGAAIKTASRYITEKFPGCGYVTADDDGQHSPEDILKVMAVLSQNPDSIVLGVRDFSAENVPFRSRTGNRITSIVFKMRTGMRLTDTQTGLRGIPAALTEKSLQSDGDRFEYEMNVLIDFADSKIPFVQVKIATIYIPTNRPSHFKTVRDSVRVYANIFQLPKFGLTGLLSALIDVTICQLLTFKFPVLISAYGARVVSGVFNFTVNRKLVFNSKENVVFSGVKYLCLFVVQIVISANLTDLAVTLGLPLIPAKLVIDTILFTISFFIQKKVVFKKSKA